MTMISVEGLGKRYRLGENTAGYGRLTDSISNALRRRRGQEAHTAHDVWALRDISFEVGEGDVVGLIGRNGAGKSTLLKLLARVTAPTEGRAQINGRVGSLLEVGTGFHQELTGRENVFLSGAILGMKRTEIQRKFDEIVAFAELDEFIDTPVKRYSSGMGLRLGFAVAAFLEPEVLLVDEVLAVGDLEFRRKCLGRIGEVSRGDGRTVLFVSHDLNSIISICSRALLLDRGKLVIDGPADQVVAAYEAHHAAAVAEGSTFERRRSDAVLRAARVEGSGDDGRAEHGRPMKLIVETNPTGRAQRFSIEVAVLDARQRPVGYFSSGIMQGRFFSAGEIAECVIPYAPWVPGIYSLELAATMPGAETFDEWKGEVAFDVARFDPFDIGSTFMPNDLTGNTVPQHEWLGGSSDPQR